MKWLIPAGLVLVVLSLGTLAVVQNVPCAQTFDSGDVTLEVGQCVKTQSGWTVRLESAFFDPSSAVFKLFNADGAPVTEKNLALGDAPILIQEASIELLGVTRPQRTPRVSARIQSWTHLSGGESLKDFPQPKRAISAARIGNQYTLADGSKVTLDSYKNGRMYFLVKQANTLKSVDLAAGQHYSDGVLDIQFFGIRETVGGTTEYLVGISARPAKATSTPETPTATATPTTTAKPSLAPLAPSVTPVSAPTQEASATPTQNGGLSALIDGILSFFRNLFGG